MNLNIIGNGFDLYNGLPSSYYHFGCYLIKTDPMFYEEMARLYSFKFREIYSNYPDLEYDYMVEDIFWSNFENHLATVDENFVVGTHDYDLGLENDDPIEIEMDEYLIAHRLKKKFGEWVFQTLDTSDNYRTIYKYRTNLKTSLDFSELDYFITFNYTHLLQRIYKINDSQIHYVHGECTGVDDDYSLVVGHGDDNRINELKDKIIQLETEYNFKQTSKNFIDENKCLVRYIEILKKDVDHCLYKCRNFYRKINDSPELITVYGLSMGAVDIPYLVDLRDRWPNAYWRFSYYSKGDIERINEVTKRYLKLTSGKFTIFELKNSVSNSIKNKIVNKSNIEMVKTC